MKKLILAALLISSTASADDGYFDTVAYDAGVLAACAMMAQGTENAPIFQSVAMDLIQELIEADVDKTVLVDEGSKDIIELRDKDVKMSAKFCVSTITKHWEDRK